MQGKVGEWVFGQRCGQTTVSQKAAKKKTPVRSMAQMRNRTRVANLYAMWRAFHGDLKPSFEVKGKTLSNFNEFLKANLSKNSMNVYLTKSMASQGACVAAPYLLSRGTLESIGVEVDRDGRVSSSIVLGNDFVIDASTTVQEFSQQVVQHNKAFQDGDQITCFAALQRTDPVTGYPTVTMNSDAVVLDTTDASGRKLLDVVTPVGFTARDGYLSSGAALEGGIAWIHSRKQNGVTRVSTQYLMGDNSMLEDYVTTDAFLEAVESYGGVNKYDYLTPGSTNV